MSSDPDQIAELFESVSLRAPENAVGFVLWRVLHRYQREVDHALGELDLTHLQFTTLTLAAWLTRTGEPATQAELARFGDIHPMQVSLMLKALEQKGLAIRTKSRVNSLAKCVEVTPAGLSVLRRALPLVIEVQYRLFGEPGRPGGSLLKELLQADQRPA